MRQTSHAIKLALGADFLTAFSRLPQKQQKKVRHFLDEFTTTPRAASHNYEKIRGARDPNLRSVRVDQDYRGILLAPDRGDVHVLLWVDKHDDAYAWAIRRVCAVHPGTGTMQVLLTEEEVASSMAQSAPAPEAATPTRALFDRHTDEELVSLGIPPSLLPSVRELHDEGEIDRLERVLPREAFEAVFMLAAGYSVDEARAELGIAREKSVDTTDFAAAIERDSSRRHFVVVSDSAEMEKLLAAPLEQWRVFLHPSQRRLAELQAAGPVRLLGSAGTGKTVVAMHRAAWLARNACNHGQKILFTTFTRNLAADIAANLKKLCSREEWERIEVINLDAWARRFLEKQGFAIRLSYQDGTAEDLWKKALSLGGASLAHSPDFVRAEWDNVIQAHGIETCDAYMGVTRAGRSERLGRAERKALWPIFEEYRALLNERGLAEPPDAYRTAARLITERKPALPYQAIVVDEAQDFGNEAFRLLRSIVPAQPNDIFLVGDAHQRIYGHQVVLSRCGIDIRGRGRKMRINYRTTEEVRNWATGLLKGLSFDDLDAGADDPGDVRSLTHGQAPIVHACNDLAAAAELMGNHVRTLLDEENASPETICIVAPSRRDLEVLERRMTSSFSKVHRVEPDKPEDSSAEGLRLATIHRVKGLEFDHVILADTFDDLPSPAHASDRGRQRRALLYVAATRARRSLFVCRVPA